jgi:hypothetical protein
MLNLHTWSKKISGPKNKYLFTDLLLSRDLFCLECSRGTIQDVNNVDMWTGRSPQPVYFLWLNKKPWWLLKSTCKMLTYTYSKAIILMILHTGRVEEHLSISSNTLHIEPLNWLNSICSSIMHIVSWRLLSINDIWFVWVFLPENKNHHKSIYIST